MRIKDRIYDHILDAWKQGNEEDKGKLLDLVLEDQDSLNFLLNKLIADDSLGIKLLPTSVSGKKNSF